MAFAHRTKVRYRPLTAAQHRQRVNAALSAARKRRKPRAQSGKGDYRPSRRNRGGLITYSPQYPIG